MTGSVYFFACAGRIKIGYSGNVEQRLRTHRNTQAHDIEVIGTIEGTKQTEADLHYQLRKHRIRNEWFHDCPEVRSKLEGIRTTVVTTSPLAEESVSECECEPEQTSHHDLWSAQMNRFDEMSGFVDFVTSDLRRSGFTSAHKRPLLEAHDILQRAIDVLKASIEQGDDAASMAGVAGIIDECESKIDSLIGGLTATAYAA